MWVFGPKKKICLLYVALEQRRYGQSSGNRLELAGKLSFGGTDEPHSTSIISYDHETAMWRVPLSAYVARASFHFHHILWSRSYVACASFHFHQDMIHVARATQRLGGLIGDAIAIFARKARRRISIAFCSSSSSCVLLWGCDSFLGKMGMSTSSSMVVDRGALALAGVRPVADLAGVFPRALDALDGGTAACTTSISLSVSLYLFTRVLIALEACYMRWVFLFHSVFVCIWSVPTCMHSSMQICIQT